MTEVYFAPLKKKVVPLHLMAASTLTGIPPQNEEIGRGYPGGGLVYLSSQMLYLSS